MNPTVDIGAVRLTVEDALTIVEILHELDHRSTA